MTYMEILQKWAEFSEYNPEQTKFYFGSISYETRRGNELMSKVAERYDDTGILRVLFAKKMFIDWIKECKTSFFDLMNNPTDYNKIKDMWEAFDSSGITDAEKLMIEQMNVLVEKVIHNKMIGELNWEQEKTNLFNSISHVLTGLDKCRYDTFLKGGPIQTINNISTHIHVFPTISHCVLTLEASIDGLYLCYINNNASSTGFFGFFIKSNGTICSVSERLIEAYGGQHSNRRNNRFAEDKQFELFPYNYIFTYTEHDYKGYASKHIIDEEKLAFFNLGPKVYLPLLLAMMLISRQFVGKDFDGEQVFVDALMPINRQSLESGEHALALIENSKVLAVNELRIDYTTDDVLSNTQGYKFDRSLDPTLTYYEDGQFKGFNQIFVDTYGEGFVFDPMKVFESNAHLKALEGQVWTEDDEFEAKMGRKKRPNTTINDQLIGSKKYMELQAYYQARKQLADYIKARMEEAQAAFGGTDTTMLHDWYMGNLNRALPFLLDIICKHELEGESKKQVRTLFNIDYPFTIHDANTVKEYMELDLYEVNKIIEGETEERYGNYTNNTLNELMRNTQPLKSYGYWDYQCRVSEYRANVWFTFNPMNWMGLQYLTQTAELPKILIGWKSSSKQHFYTGNSILDVVDPVSEIQTPYESRGSFCAAPTYFNFTFKIGFSKRGLKSLLNTYKSNQARSQS